MPTQYRSRRSMLASLVASGLSVSLLAPSTMAQVQPSPQGPAPLQGVVIDEATYQPVDSASVTVVGSLATVVTGRWGSFSFHDVGPGTASLQVSAPGRPSIVQDVEVRAGRVAFVQIVLPSVAAVLSELLVSGRPTARPSDVAETAADLLAMRVPRTRGMSAVVGKSDYPIELRPGTTFQGNPEPIVLLDGVVMALENAYDALAQIRASDVEEIEVLKGPAAAFLYPFAASGVVSVRTKRGGR